MANKEGSTRGEVCGGDCEEEADDDDGRQKTF